MATEKVEAPRERCGGRRDEALESMWMGHKDGVPNYNDPMTEKGQPLWEWADSEGKVEMIADKWKESVMS